MQYHFNLDILPSYHSLTLFPRFAKCLHVACERVTIFQWKIFEKATFLSKMIWWPTKKGKGTLGWSLLIQHFILSYFFLNPLTSGAPSCARKKNCLENPVRLYAPFHIFLCRLIVHTHIDPVQLWVLCRRTSFPQFLHLFSVSKLNNLFAFYYLNPLASRVSGGNDMWRLLWSCHPCAE